MRALAAGLGKWSLRFALFMYRSLALFFLFIAALNLWGGSGRWFNEFVVFAVLSLPLVAGAIMRRRRGTIKT